MEEIFAPASKVDLGGDSQSVSKLQENFNAVKPGFLVRLLFLLSHYCKCFVLTTL